MNKREQSQVLREAILRLDFHRTLSLDEKKEEYIINGLVEYAGAIARAEQLEINPDTAKEAAKAFIDAHKQLKERTI